MTPQAIKRDLDAGKISVTTALQLLVKWYEDFHLATEEIFSWKLPKI